jgi:hypothetical protein
VVLQAAQMQALQFLQVSWGDERDQATHFYQENGVKVCHKKEQLNRKKCLRIKNSHFVE